MGGAEGDGGGGMCVVFFYAGLVWFYERGCEILGKEGGEGSLIYVKGDREGMVISDYG